MWRYWWGGLWKLGGGDCYGGFVVRFIFGGGVDVMLLSVVGSYEWGFIFNCFSWCLL